jgi:hypothetical protein
METKIKKNPGQKPGNCLLTGDSILNKDKLKFRKGPFIFFNTKISQNMCDIIPING